MTPESWEAWRELINWSTPLAGVIIGLLALYRIGKWIAGKLVEPAIEHMVNYFGKDGHFPTYLKVQEQEAKAQTEMLRSMFTSFKEYSEETKTKFAELMESRRVQGDDMRKIDQVLVAIERVETLALKMERMAARITDNE